jgi:hypothetical protein
VFSYSYSARSIFRLAHDRGYPCVLGQMDPGPEDPALEDERLVTSVIAATSFSLFLCISLRSSLGRTGMR